MFDAPKRAAPPHTENRSMTLDLVVSTILLVAIVAAVFSTIVTHDFSNWDDPKHLAAIWTPGWERAWRIVTDFHLRYTGVTYYGPLHFLSLMADQALLGPEAQPQAWIAKLMNLVYHAANTVLVFLLFYSLGVGRRAALLGALVFGVHPVQVGTVAWIAERKNLLGCFFYLASFLGFVQYVRAPRLGYMLLTVLCFVAGLFSKPSVVTLPVVLLLWYSFCTDGASRGRIPYALFAFLFASALGWGLYTASMEVAYEGMLPPIWYRPLVASRALIFYIGKFLYPSALAPVYPKWKLEGHMIAFLASFVATLGVTAFLAYGQKQIGRLVLFGLVFFVINVMPVAGFVPFGHMSHTFVADHFMYLPMVGLSLVVARGIEVLLEYWKDKKRLQTGLLVGSYAVVCALGVLSIRQESIWQDPVTLWEANLKVNKTSPAVYNNYGLACLTRGRVEEAKEAFEKALEIFPGLAPAHQNLGRVHYMNGDREKARTMFEKAQSLKPEDNYPRLMLGTMLREERKFDDAIDFLKKSLKDTPQSYVLHLELARTYSESGGNEEALQELTRGIEIDRLNPLAYLNKGAFLLTLKRTDEAMAQLKLSLRNGESAQARNLLGRCYVEKGDLNRALGEFRRAYAIQPPLPAVQDNLATTLIKMGKLPEARKFCEDAANQRRQCSEPVLKKLSAGLESGKRKE